MHWEIENPADYQAGLYIRLSKEDENEGPSESVSNQKSLLEEFVRQHRLRCLTPISTTGGAAPILTARRFSG